MATQLVSPDYELFLSSLVGGRIVPVLVAPALDYRPAPASDCEIVITNEADVSVLQL